MKLKYEIDHTVAAHIAQSLYQIQIPGQLAGIHKEALDAVDNPTNRKAYENFLKEEASKAESAQTKAQEAMKAAAAKAVKPVAPVKP